MVASKIDKVGAPRFKLPPTLLSAPLEPRRVEQLSKKEMRDYKHQLQKYEQVIKTWAKQWKELGKHPKNHVFTREDAVRLAQGEFYSDEEEDDDE